MRRPTLRRPGEPVWSVVLALAGVAATLVAIVALLARWYSGGWQPLIVVAALAHQLLWAAPVALVLFAGCRRWYATGAAAVVVVLGALTQLPAYVGADTPGNGRTLTVLQANLKIGAAQPADLVRTVRAQHVDVLTTEELTPSERDRLVSAGLRTTLPHVYDAALGGGGGGLAIWSRYPLEPEHNFPHFELGVLQARLHLDATHAITVLAVHLLPPYPYPSGEWVAETGRLRTILATAARSPAPVVVGGDFNATTDNAQFRDLLEHGYSDATEHCGAGYHSTYPADRWFPPMIAIDHVLSRDAPAHDATTLALPGSDHRALLAHLVVPRG